ncbi:hypothetical protein GALMADRAFT_51755 [Galerina marginata CBS 339.88]|uniref:Uncharacterized protein n=1 Tax=Galerina marginata (strain CBS 339.88) TaxID=685588 RepID=A0A067U3Y8_GALM3|nr:hypothetical protein GALMADRAFT_51755 [Galerina marginata CBS 339.88]
MPESPYNEGKGIQISASLHGLLPIAKSGEKRRANAKAPVTTKVLYLHEKTPFINGLLEIIGHNLKRKDLCKGGVDRHGNLNGASLALFSLEYSIPRTQLKDVDLLSENDWETFLAEAGKKPSAQGKLVIREKPVTNQAEELDNEDENDKKKKKKKHVPTAEEVEQDTIIKRLTEIHMCEDRKCTFTGPCWVDAENTAHIHLTHLHLRTWAAAIVRP